METKKGFYKMSNPDLKNNVIAFPDVLKKNILPSSNQVQSNAISSLKENLKALHDLHSRLKFMLTELEDLVKR
jgi:hypothetical protein